MARDFSWEALREQRRARRRAEGATDEEIAAEEIPADLVVWSPGQVRANEKARKPKPRVEGGRQRWFSGSRAEANKAGKKNGPAKGSPRRGGLAIDEQVRQQILECHRRGIDTPTTAKLVGVDKSTVVRYVERDGLTPIAGKPGRRSKAQD